VADSKPYWKPFLVGENPVGLSHLEPIDFTCQAPDKPVRRIHAVFSDHVFTTAFNEATHNLDQLIFRNRVFCADRYRDSFLLPEIISKLPSAKVIQTWEKRNYVYYIRLASKDVAKPYHVFFELKKRGKGQNGSVELRVESAYQMDSTYSNPNSQSNSIKFFNLVENTYMGRPIKFAHRK